MNIFILIDQVLDSHIVETHFKFDSQEENPQSSLSKLDRIQKHLHRLVLNELLSTVK